MYGPIFYLNPRNKSNHNSICKFDSLNSFMKSLDDYSNSSLIWWDLWHLTINMKLKKN